MRARSCRLSWGMALLLSLLLTLLGIGGTDMGCQIWLRRQVSRTCPEHTSLGDFGPAGTAWGQLLWLSPQEAIYWNSMEGGLIVRRLPHGWNRRLLAADQVRPFLLSATPDGRWLAVESNVGVPHLPAGQFDPVTRTWHPAPEWPGLGRGVWLIDPRRAAHLLPLSASDRHELALSPDGRQAAWVVPVSPASGPSASLCWMDLTTGESRQVDRSPHGLFQPVFSPDGQRLAYWSDPGGGLAIHDLRTGRTHSWWGVTLNFSGRMPRLIWRPDGKALRCVTEDGAIEATPDRERWLWMFRRGLQPDDPFRQQQALSPDGRWLAYEQDQAIWLVDLDTRRRCRLAGGEMLPSGRELRVTDLVWRADGQAVALHRWTQGGDPFGWHRGPLGTDLGWWAAPLPQRWPPELPQSQEKVTLPPGPLTLFDALVRVSDQTPAQWVLTLGFQGSLPEAIRSMPLKKTPLSLAMAALADAYGYRLHRIGTFRYWFDREPAEGFFAPTDGSLRVSVQIHGEPADGLVVLDLSRFDHGIRTSWWRLLATLDNSGKALLGPLKPGTYEVTLSYRTWRNRFRCRYGVWRTWAPSSEAWVGGRGWVHIAPGKIRELPPLRLVRAVKMKYPLCNRGRNTAGP